MYLTTVLNKLYFKTTSKQLIGFEDEKQALYDMLEATVTQRRGDSCLIVGPRNTGKSVLVDQCIEKLETNFPEQFILIKLSGLLYQEDRSAFREIARQIDTIIPDDINVEQISIMDTLQSIFKLFGRAEQEAYSTDTKRVSVVFVLDDMDKFASGSRQSLLYNLLDFSKNSSLGVAVIGTSAKFTAQEAMEKRVRSRFGSLVFHTTRAQSREQFDQIARSLLVSEDEQWNQRIDEYIDTALKPIIDQVYYSTKDVRDLGVTLAPIIYKHHEEIYAGTFTEVESNPYNIPASTETRLEGLCELDWAILICSARVLEKYQTNQVNFVLADGEYRQMATQLHYERSQGSFSGYRVWSPKAVKLAWERLQRMSMLGVPPATNATHLDLMPYRLDTTLDELRLLVPQDHALYSWTRL